MLNRHVIIFSLCAFVLPTFCKEQLTNPLFVAIAQGNARQVERLLQQNKFGEIQHNEAGNSPLMEAIIALGEKLLEMEAQALTQDLTAPKHLSDDFRSFLRSFVISFILGYATSEMQSNIEKIPSSDDCKLITVLQSITKSTLPVISKSAYVWCAYALVDYGIATGQKQNPHPSGQDSSNVENYKKTIDALLSKPTIDVNHVNHHGETALSLVIQYKNKIRSGELKVIFYQIEQALLSEGALANPQAHDHAHAYTGK